MVEAADPYGGDPRDAILLAQCPVVAAPYFGPLPPLREPGQRLIVGENGLFVEVRNAWLHTIQPCGWRDRRLPLPYVHVRTRLELAFGGLPLALLRRFIDAAREALPHELVGALLFDATNAQLRLVLHTSLDSSHDRVHYAMAPISPDESLVLDLHSHGLLPAVFSPEDDADDRSIKLSGVFGHLHHHQPSAAFRLCINGSFFSLPHPWEHTHKSQKPA